MRLKTFTLAAALIGGLVALPTAASADHGRGDHRPGHGWNNGHHNSHGYDRGHKRRVCHWERHRGHRVQRCSWR